MAIAFWNITNYNIMTVVNLVDQSAIDARKYYDTKNILGK